MSVYSRLLPVMPDDDLGRIFRGAQRSVEAWSEATREHGSLLQSWIRSDEVVVDQRYPDPDIIDRRYGFQYFYHCHRHSDMEHGHLHLFYHARASGARRYLNSEKRPWRDSAPSHLFAIGLDNRGMPLSIFTVNRWVTDGYWFDAATTLAMVARFRMLIDGEHAAASLWLTGFVRMYLPLIDRVLQRRDSVIERAAHKASLVEALEDHRYELLASERIDWLGDIEALEAEMDKRSHANRAYGVGA